MMVATSPPRTARDGPELAFSRAEVGVLRLHLAGDWRLKTTGLPTAAAVATQLGSDDELRRLTLDASDLGEWDSGLLAFLVGIQELSRARQIEFDPGDLPE
jgi:phospholipid/cholesterol/gamma-HCH transport system permease protein